MVRGHAYLAAISLLVAGVLTLFAVDSARKFFHPLVNSASAQTVLIDFPDGTATPSETCGACHQAIYKEYSEGFGADTHWPRMKNYSPADPAVAPSVAMLEGVAKEMSRSPTAHAAAGNDPWPIDAQKVEEPGKDCNVCHYPMPLEYPRLDAADIKKAHPRTDNREAGITCASCHLTPDGKIRGPYEVDAPHATVKDERIKTSIACATCHAEGGRVVGKQTQTFLEWREDFYKPGLGQQQCQDCHMPKTIRKLAEDFDVPDRVVGRHIWTGGHSFQRLKSALTLAIAQPAEDKPDIAFYVTNVGAGHSVPTGSNRRAVYLIAEIEDLNGRVMATKEWMFAPWMLGRPDDRSFVEEDLKGPDPIATAQADRQGPHETNIRAGEQRVLGWTPELQVVGRYTVRARLVYDLNRYNDRSYKEDQTEIASTTMELSIATRRAGTK